MTFTIIQNAVTESFTIKDWERPNFYLIFSVVVQVVVLSKIVVDSYSSLIADFDFDKLDKAYSESRTYLQDKDGHPFAQSLDWIIRNYQTIIGGRKFKDKTVQSDNRKQGIIDRWEAVAERYAREENDNDEDN